jgi:hypothetical protein
VACCGVQPPDWRSFAFEIRSDRAIVSPMLPVSGTNHWGGVFGIGTPTIALSAPPNWRCVIGSLSTTL